MPFVIHGKIFFSPFVASPLKGKNPIPIPPNYGIRPFIGHLPDFVTRKYLLAPPLNLPDNFVCYCLFDWAPEATVISVLVVGISFKPKGSALVTSLLPLEWVWGGQFL